MNYRYAVTETQLNTNGAISHINVDHGTNKKAALSHYHNALASALDSQLVSSNVSLVCFVMEGEGYTTSETVKGNGVLQTQ